MAPLWLAALLVGCGKGPDPPPAAAPGRTQFENYCAACHQPDERGTQGFAPPLLASPWVVGPESRLIRIALHGVHGPMEVGGKTYNLEMPGFGQILADVEVAALLSFVRSRYGGSTAAITPAAVSRVRAETRGRDGYWTVDELLALR